MLKFFRSIRKKLIEEDNVRKYLFYAVGEILLVVIGILIALQVNNWNENRKLSEERVRLIQSIESDFETNRTRLKVAADFYGEINHALIRFKRLSGSDNRQLQRDSLLYYASFTFEHMEIEPAMSAYHTAVSSGKLEMVDNKKVVGLFTEFLSKFNDLNYHTYINGDQIFSGGMADIRRELGSLHQLCCQVEIDESPEYYVPELYRLSEDEMINYLSRSHVYSSFESMHWAIINILESLGEMQTITEEVLAEINSMGID